MKILAFVDTHGDMNALEELKSKAKQADLILCAGDLTMFENGLSSMLQLLESFNKMTLIVHGNHEGADEMRSECSKLKNLFFLHKKAEIIDKIAFLGFGGGGFTQSSPEMEKFFNRHRNLLKKPYKKVFITHAPPYKTKLDRLDSSHSGNNTLRNQIIKYQPELVVCGHFHENWGEQDMLGMAKIINPGPCGKLLEL